MGLDIAILFDLLVRYRHLSNCRRACPSLIIQMTESILSGSPEPAVTVMRYVCCNNTVGRKRPCRRASGEGCGYMENVVDIQA